MCNMSHPVYSHKVLKGPVNVKLIDPKFIEKHMHDSQRYR